MPNDYKYAKFIGLLLGMLFGNALILVPSVLYRLYGHDSSLPGDVHALGPRSGFVYGLLGTLPVAFLAGLIFGIAGFQWGKNLKDTAGHENKRRALIDERETSEVWPPAPKTKTRSSYDDT